MIDAADIHRLPFFRGLSPAKLEDALQVLMPSEIPPGQVLMVEGESDRSMLIVMDGELSVRVGRTQTEIARLGRGEIVGEMALFGVLDRRSATVLTRMPTRILLLDLQAAQHLRRKRSPVIQVLEEHALLTMARRLRMTQARIGHLAAGGELPAEPQVGVFRRLGSMFGLGGVATPPMPDPAVVVASSPIFRDQDPQVVARLGRGREIFFVNPGQRVMTEGEQGGDCFLVASGQVDSFRATGTGHHERIGRVREGGLFGVISMVDGGPRSCSCIAMQPGWIVRMPSWLLIGHADITPHEVGIFRRATIEALAAQLRLANAHVEYLEQLVQDAAMRQQTPESWVRSPEDTERASEGLSMPSLTPRYGEPDRR